MEIDRMLSEQLTEWRHYIHQHPETAFEEKNTSDFVAAQLMKMGLEVHRNIGQTGIVANLKVGNGTKVIGLRADMDAINLTETGDLPYCSENVGKMHACGHDGHTATLLGAAKLLSERRDFSGTVRFIFQPAEEPGLGALAMMADGMLEQFPLDEVYGFHNTPSLPEGEIHTRKGGLMASEDDFIIKIKGVGGHASSPHLTHDPIVIAAEIIMALQTIVSRNVNPLEPAVISFTEIHTDGVRNAIPSNVVISGDTRSFSPETQKLLEEQMRTTCEHICQLNGAELEFEYSHEFVPLVNDEACVQAMGEAAARLVEKNRINLSSEPVMASEDFARFMQEVPGCYVNIGSGSGLTKNAPLHNTRYDYNDNILELGARLLEEVIKVRMPQQECPVANCRSIGSDGSGAV